MIGVDGEKGVGKSCLINKFANDDFENGIYKETLRAYITTTHIQLDNYTIKVEFLEIGDLRPNKIYIDGAVLVYDISQPDSKTKIKELLLDECSSYFKEKNYFGEEFLFNETSIEEKTSASLNKILEETNDLNELTSPKNKQFKFIMEHATKLYLYEIPKVIYGRQQQVE
ncbi:5174_t:CDS:2, partial [Dentiscutata heterogama]